MKIVEVEDTFYYIPVLETIQIQLGCPRILEMVMAGHVKSIEPDILEDFCDGSFFQNHELFANDERALILLLYYDDVNLCNPLTNRNHKLSLFYYQIANLHREYRSKLKSMHAFTICKTEHLSNPEYGFDKVLKPLVEDMKLLGSDRGYSFSLPSGLINLRGGILAFLADTPASQKAGGFKEGVGGARRKCRHCMATFETMQCHFSEEDFEPRNADDHEQQLLKLENSHSKYMKEFYSKHYGINRRTKLLEAPYFDACEQLIQDIMHVFLEGILAYEIKLLLNYYISEINAFGLADLNSKIQSFVYGYSNAKNKPAVILSRDLDRGASTNLGQSASQMWLLSCVLPFVLAELVETDTDRWRCFISGIELMSICLAHKISLTAVVYLRKAIQNHLTLFKSLYEEVANIIPKQHYLVHLPSLILKFGPLIRSWCMRFEAKHAYFKDQAKIIKNFKNLPLSLSKRYLSSLQADYIKLDDTDEGPLFRDDMNFGVSGQLYGDEIESAKRDIERFYGVGSVDGTAQIYLLYSVQIYGTLYKQHKNAFLNFGCHNSLPEFGRIMKIWFIPQHGIFFALQVVVTTKYNEDLNAFQTKESELPQGFEIVKPADLLTQYVYHSHSFQNESYIILKENPFSYM